MDTCIIEVIWSRDGSPRFLGPFDTSDEAEEWGCLNLPDAAWGICPLMGTSNGSNSSPHLTSGDALQALDNRRSEPTMYSNSSTTRQEPS